MEIDKCCYCGNKPTIIKLPGDLFYAQCPCKKHGLYTFIGATAKNAIEQWNYGQHSRAMYNRGKK